MKQTNFRLINFQIGIASEDDSGDTGYVVMNLTSNQLMELHYIEDITKSNILMMVKINDSGSGICDAIVGMEPIEIIWTDDSIGKGMEGNVYKQSMIIYDIKDRIIKDGKQSSAVLYCISVDALRNSATKISRRFGKGGGESTSDIVEQLITRDLSSTKPFKIDKSITKLSFVSPYWDPYTIISWLAWRSISVSYTHLRAHET